MFWFFTLEKIDDLSSMSRNLFLSSNISQFRVPNFFHGYCVFAQKLSFRNDDFSPSFAEKTAPSLPTQTKKTPLNEQRHRGIRQDKLFFPKRPALVVDRGPSRVGEPSGFQHDFPGACRFWKFRISKLKISYLVLSWIRYDRTDRKKELYNQR